MADAAQAKAKSSSSGLVAWILVIVLLGAVFWLASERNARHWSLAVEGGHLVVQRGRFFPTGARTIDASDPQLGKAYAPIPVPAGAKPAEAEFDDRVALDHALFDQLLPWAKAAAEKPDGESQKAAMGLAERASLLPGLSPAQLDQLGSLRGDLGYTAAIGELQLAAGLLESARRRLLLSQQQGGSRSVAAGALSGELKGLADRLGDLVVGRAPQAALQATSQPPKPSVEPVKPSPTPAAATDGGVPDAGPRR